MTAHCILQMRFSSLDLNCALFIKCNLHVINRVRKVAFGIYDPHKTIPEDNVFVLTSPRIMEDLISCGTLLSWRIV